MSEKRLPEYDLQLVNKDDVESGGQLIESYMASLAEGKETVVAADSQTDDSIRIILQKDIDFRSLPPIDILRFDGDPSKWPGFINNFKTRVHMKVTFNGSMRMERLHSVLDGDAKKAVSSIGTNSIFLQQH